MFSLNQFNIKKVSDSNNTSLFEIGPLPKGYGNTLGIIIRRVLYSSIQGSAITAIKIDNVQHEYSTLEGLPDDILTILLSLKNVVLVSSSLEPVILEIEKKGKDGEVVEVTAGDIVENQYVKVINPEYVITRLTSSKAKFKAEFTVERGVGFLVGNDEKRKELSMLPLDANFSPVKLVSYEISPVRVGQETELDQLNISIQTNGSVTGIEALHEAGNILNGLTEYFVKKADGLLNGDEVTIEVNKKQKTMIEVEEKAAPKVALNVVDLNLSTRLTNALLKSGYEDLNKLEGLTEEEVSNIRGMGSKSVTELMDAIKKYNIKLV